MLVHDRDARIKDAATVTKRILEAYPAVLPDGTGRHTAVIVPTRHAVDATGDTEIFTSAGFQAAQQRTSEPGSGHRVDAEDSKRTVPHASSPGRAPGASNASMHTGAATPVEMGRGDITTIPPLSALLADSRPGSSPSGAQGEARARPTGPKTDPLPLWQTSASSSASGVAMPGTPPLIEPLAHHDVAPDTQRDASLAVRADRRRFLTLGIVGALIAAVAVGGYLAGRRATPPTVASPSAASAVVVPTAPTTATATVTTSAATPGATSTAAVGERTASPAVPVESLTPATSASAGPPAVRPRRHFKVKPAASDAPDEPSLPENPFPAPAPSASAPAP
jgi:hypothetical protein